VVELLEPWAREHERTFSEAGLTLSHRESEHGGSATVEAMGSQRGGYLTLWDSGEMDFQVLRRADDLLVLNEHRLVRTPDEVGTALNAWRLVVTYVDPRDT
jgi:hypothetical protein